MTTPSNILAPSAADNIKLPGIKARRARALLQSPQLWRKWLLFWMGAILVGIAASVFALIADAAQRAFAHVLHISPYLPLIVSPAIFVLVTWITRRWVPTAVGSGIPQAIAARAVRTPEGRRHLLGPRIIAGKMVLTAIALLGGASVGREGPTVQVGASIMLSCARLAGMATQRGVVLAGAAAGVAAAFNTPLAGIVFAIEEMARGFEHRTSGVVLTAIVLSGVASMSILGNYDYFGYAGAHFSLARDWFAILALGVAGGLAGSAFARTMTDGSKLLRAVGKGFGFRHPLCFAALCGLVVAMLGIVTHGATYGTGYSVANDLLHERTTVSFGYAAAKFVATALSNMSGIPGGLFSPSLTVGAALGSSMAPLFGETPFQLAVLIGMVAYFAGVTQAPITAFVIVLEITGKGVTPAPLIGAAVIATAIGRLISHGSLYQILAKDFIAQQKPPLAVTPQVP